MTSRRILLSLLLLVLTVVWPKTTLLVAYANEECATYGESGECINPDADVGATATDADTSSATTPTSGEAVTEPPSVVGVEKEADPNCPSRDLIIRCAGQHLDTNGNGKLDREELDTAIKSLPWYAQGILQILGSVDKMMKKCDVDGDGAIGMDYDMTHNQETCLATCFKRRAFRNSFFPDCE